MAKEKVLCPFSKKLCAECALYRGRHYYLCYVPAYRGFLGSEGKKRRRLSGTSSDFKIPEIKTKAMDPFNELKEQEKEES